MSVSSNGKTTQRPKKTKVDIIHEVSINRLDGGKLCFQWCLFRYDNRDAQYGYRFIWRTPQGKLVTARGQSRLPSASCIDTLLRLASRAGWYVSAEGVDFDYPVQGVNS